MLAPGGWGSAPGGCLLQGVPALGGGGGIPACTEADPHCGQTHMCKNITFTTSLQMVIKCVF